VFPANAGPAETQKMISETSGRTLGRNGKEKIRTEKMIIEAKAKEIHEAHKKALNIVNQAFEREAKAPASIR
jgi:hypothetical protein